jgi:CTP:molybdopterin cytidylyltransferase MocA
MINKILESGGTFKCIKDKSIKIIDVDTSKDIKRAKDII